MKKKKIINKYISIVLCIITIIIIISLLKSAIVNSKKYNSIDDFKTVKEYINYNNCKYKKEKISNIEGINKDIYIEFDCELYDGTKSNQVFFEKIIKGVSHILDYTSFRLIDTRKDITIITYCNYEKKKLSGYYINGENNYFEKNDSRINLKNILDDELTRFEIEASELNSIIQNNWLRSSIEFGTKDSVLNGYDIYFEEGIEVKSIYKKIFNIVFTEKYEKSVVNNIFCSTSLEIVKKILGEPTFGFGELIGYKSKEIYVFFSEGQISVYRVEEVNSTELMQLINDFNGNLNLKSFISSVTDLWPDYDLYNYDSDYVELLYSLKGVKFQFNINKKNGVLFYNNYNGYVAQNKKLRDYQNSEIQNIPTNTFFENTDSVYNYESERYYNLIYALNPDGMVGNNERVSNKFRLKNIEENGYILKIIVLCVDKTVPHSEIQENGEFNSILWYNDTILLYSVKNKGIYKYNCITRERILLVEGVQEFTINNVIENTILYDNNKTIEV